MKVSRLALTALSAAAIALVSGQVQALGLGRLDVQSSLGEALRAEIDVTSLSPEEASSLQIRIASPETYRAAGVDYHPALAGAQVSLARRTDGRPYLRLISDRVVTEPFVDVILEMTWSSGRLVREYTLLLDPPRTNLARPAAPATPAVVAAAPAAPPAPATPSPVAPAAEPLVAQAAEPVRPAPSAPAPTRAAEPPARAASPAAPAAARPAPAPAAEPAPQREAAPSAPRVAASPGEVRVRRGDTLGGIARRVQHEGVSLDQMLVSMFRANPQAFMGDNMNRLRAGAILKVPEAADAQAVERGEARSLIVAQAADFGAYRRRLATQVARAPDAPARQTGGKVQAAVEDRKQAAAPTPDQLKLSQGAVKPSAPEAQISREAASKEASTRVAELSRNIEELKQIKGAASAVDSGKAAPAASAPVAGGLALPSPGGVLAQKPADSASVPSAASAAAEAAPAVASAPADAAAVVAAASAPAEAASAADVARAASAPAVETPPPVSAPATPTAEEPGLLDQILESPYLLPAGALLAALLAGFGIYRVRASKRQSASETSFMESRLQPDSFFGASGGQRVDTSDGAAASPSGAPSSSMNYSLSQLDAIGDVDPVAEADVYLAYGRDLQAEEILKEAMRTDPNRLAVRTKLLEVYAKRRDVKGFELLATQLFTLTRGEGPDWQRAQELGRSIDPDNSLYSSGARPDSLSDEEPFSEPLGASTLPHSVMPSAPAFRDSGSLRPGAGDAASADVDIDLSLDAGVQPARPAPAPAGGATAAGVAAGAAAAAGAAIGGQVVDIDLDPSPPRSAKTAPIDVAVGDDEALEFDLSDISLDLDSPGKGADAVRGYAASNEARPSGFVDLSGLPDDPDSQFNDDGDPLERKLDLADEFRQIGDLDGARDLLNEVISGSDGALRQKAQTMLDSLG